jgi:hypothetical protein
MGLRRVLRAKPRQGRHKCRPMSPCIAPCGALVVVLARFPRLTSWAIVVAPLARLAAGKPVPLHSPFTAPSNPPIRSLRSPRLCGESVPFAFSLFTSLQLCSPCPLWLIRCCRSIRNPKFAASPWIGRNVISRVRKRSENGRFDARSPVKGDRTPRTPRSGASDRWWQRYPWASAHG